MVATPKPVDLQSQINDLNRKLNNLINSPRPVNTVAVGQPIIAENGTVLLQSDPLGGIAYPWYSVPLLQTFTGFTGSTSTTSYPSGFAAGFQQMDTNAPGLFNPIGSTWFAGFLPYISHPRLYLQTFCATATSGGTCTWEVAITQDNFVTFTSLGTFVSTSFSGQFQNNSFNLVPYLGLTNVGLGLILQSITGANGDVLMQPYGCFLRGSV